LTNFSGRKSKNSTLRPAAYQLIPLIKLLRNGFHSILISDGVGVGKTISAGYIISFLQESLSRPSLVVCPPMLVDKWLLELRGKFDIKSIPIRSIEDLPTAIAETRLKRIPKVPTYVMASSLLTQKESFDFKDIGLIVFDEIHNYRNSETLSHKTALRLSGQSKHRVGLSATPINNSMEDLVSEVSILLPRIEREVLDLTIKDLWETDRSTVSLPLVTRFTKEKLGIHFARRVIKQYMISYPADYNEKVLARVQAIRKKYDRKGGFFDDVTYFRMAASSPVAISKALNHDLGPESDPKLELFQKLVSENPSTHIITFCEFQETASYLVEKVSDRESFLITGSIPIFERESLIKAFRKSPKALLIMTPVGTEGLDLQFCSTLINYDLHWNPMKIEQRIGRIDRIGQIKKEILILNFTVEDSIDARVIQVLENKLKIIAKSVFKTGEILTPQRSPGPLLVDDFAINKEASKGRSLIAAIDFSQTIPEPDYEIIKYVKTEYCSSTAIRKAGETSLSSEGFLDFCKETKSWLRSVDQKVSKFRDSINFYE